MIHLVLLIVDDLERLPSLVKAWREIGVPGATILESIGAHRATSWLSQMGLSALDRLFEADEVRRRTILVALDDEELLARALAEAERVMDGFDRPNSGLLLVLPVSQALGLQKIRPEPVAPAEELPPAVQPDWIIRRDTPVEKVAAIIDQMPTVVQPDTTLSDVAQAMLDHPTVHTACVANEAGRLVGLIALRALADDLFFHILPEEFLSESRDLEHVMEFAARSRMRTAADAMQEPVWVKHGETVKEAFKRMHANHLVGLPVVDEQYQIAGYIDLLELMAICYEGVCEWNPSEDSREGTTA